MNLREESHELAGDLVALRRNLHRAPEIGLELPRTQERVLESLAGLPLEISLGDSLNSITAVLRGRRRDRSVLLRADMDALTVDERLDTPYRSQTDGVMHACGHDLHTSMLVGAAKLLSSHHDRIDGDVVFMFQPGEEGWDGARAMVDEGVLQASGSEPLAAYALHVMSSGLPFGRIVTRPGPMMAASDALYVTVQGSGGHGSAPHKAHDPIPAACEMVTALQTFLTRKIDPFEPAVITVGSLHGGTRRNVIADRVTFEATIRSFDPVVRGRIEDGVVRMCEGIAAAHGLEVDVRYEEEYPVTVNSPVEAEFAGHTAAEAFGQDRFQQADRPVTGSEDFCRVIDRVPGAMLFLGATPADRDPQRSADNHSPHAEFDDGVLGDGAALYAELASRRLAKAVDDAETTGERSA